MKYSFQEGRMIAIRDLLAHMIRNIRWIVFALLFFMAEVALADYINGNNRFLSALRAYMVHKEDKPPVEPGLPIKYAIMGAFLGIIFAGGILIVQYLLDDHLKTDEELSMSTKHKVLGRLPVTEKRGAEAWADRLLYGKLHEDLDSERELARERILTACKEQGVKHLLLGGELTEKQRRAFSPIEASLRENDTDVEWIGEVGKKQDAQGKLEKGTDILLIVTEQVSKYRDIARTLTACSRQQANILGFVVFS